MSVVDEYMFHYWFMLNKKYQTIMEEVEKEDGIAGMVVSIILILIAVAVAATFKKQIGDYVKKIFERLPTEIK